MSGTFSGSYDAQDYDIERVAIVARVPGRAFLRWVYALTQKVQKHYHHVKITKEVRADFETWYHFFSEYNGRSFFLLDAVHTDRALQLYTDSSKTIGYGAVLGTEWLYGTWP